MKITAVDIPAAQSTGLGHIKMSRLGNVVILAGKNGSGKSRILQAINGAFSRMPRKALVDSKLKRVRDLQAELSHYRGLSEEIRNNKPNSAEAAQRQILGEYELRISSLQTEIAETKRSINYPAIQVDHLDEHSKIIWNVPDQLSIPDYRDRSVKAIKEVAQHAKQLGIGYVQASGYAYIKHIQDNWWEAQHPMSTLSADEKRSAIQSYDQLRHLIRTFLRTDLERDRDGFSTLFGFQLAEAKLSQGQAVLMQYLLQMHAQGSSLEGTIFFLDEPENHLHPAASLEVIQTLGRAAPSGQIWIATHSVSILADHDPSCIWWVEENKISHGPKMSERVLAGLVGNEERIARQQNFLGLAASQALAKFAYESLLEPIAVSTAGDDPQVLQVRQKLSELLKASECKIRVLDYGAGRGRILEGIWEEIKSDQKVVDLIDYVAFDESRVHKGDCRRLLNEVYGSDSDRYFNDMPALLSAHGESHFDLLIMCNVLHEIDPKEWLNLFRSTGKVTRLLRDGGALLILEDHLMPIGEKAYSNGFIVLDTPQLRMLFAIAEGDEFLTHDARGDGRLKAHFIRKTQLERISAATRRLALESLHLEAQDRIHEIRRRGDASFRTGTEHAFWLLQFANSRLALNELQ